MMAHELCESYGFEYEDQNQMEMYEKFGDSFGKEIWLTKTVSDREVEVGFCGYHKLLFRIKCTTADVAKSLRHEYEGDIIKSVINDDDPSVVELSGLTHYSMDSSFKKACEVVDKIFEIS